MVDGNRIGGGLQSAPVVYNAAQDIRPTAPTILRFPGSPEAWPHRIGRRAARAPISLLLRVAVTLTAGSLPRQPFRGTMRLEPKRTSYRVPSGLVIGCQNPLLPTVTG